MKLDELTSKSNSGGIILSDTSPFTEDYKTDEYNKLDKKSTTAIAVSIIIPLVIAMLMFAMYLYLQAIILGIVFIIIGLILSMIYSIKLMTEQDKIIRAKLEEFYILRYQMAHSINAVEIASLISASYANNFSQIEKISDDTISFCQGKYSYELTTDPASHVFTLKTPEKVFESDTAMKYSEFYDEMMNELPKLVFTIQKCITDTEKTK